MIRKLILITGSASGIGKYIFKHIDLETYKPIGLDLNHKGKRNTIQIDVSNYNQITEKLKKYKNKKIYSIINCAGISIDKPYHEYTEDEWNLIINSNVKSVWNLSKYFRDELIANQGCIINISSVHAISTLPNKVIYSMTKGAIESLTRGLAIELGKYGIRVNCIRPGPVATKMLNYIKEEEEKIPIRKIASTKDIYEVIVFLLKNQYINGECIAVDGGILAKLSIDT